MPALRAKSVGSGQLMSRDFRGISSPQAAAVFHGSLDNAALRAGTEAGEGWRFSQKILPDLAGVEHSTLTQRGK